MSVTAYHEQNIPQIMTQENTHHIGQYNIYINIGWNINTYTILHLDVISIIMAEYRIMSWILIMYHQNINK